MKRFLFLTLVLVLPGTTCPWGFYAHKRINRLAVFTLPAGLVGFYKAHLEYLTEHAVDPDKRRYVLAEEASRHYIDIDHYGEAPFERVPRKWLDAVDKYTEDTLRAYGIVPWHVHFAYTALVDAFKHGDRAGVLRLSADLGHYISDAHVPLHTTENYNGQLTNQRGIHGFWESRLPELFADDYDYFVGRAEFVYSPLDCIWEAVEQSHSAVDSVLTLERTLTGRFPIDRKYAFEERGASTVKTYSREFSAEYHAMLNSMVERRMREAIITVGSFWYSAWVEAGKPIMIEALDPVEEEALEREGERLDREFRSGKNLGREHDH